MKGGKQLCGQYGANTQVERPCISCYCSFDKLDNATITCTPVNGIDMKSKIQKEDEAELAKVSQHKITDNAFFGVNTADWKYGIWGMCPSEILHQYYEGIVHYTLDFFSQLYFLTLADKDSIVEYSKQFHFVNINLIELIQKQHILMASHILRKCEGKRSLLPYFI